jgi:hypothetical protein
LEQKLQRDVVVLHPLLDSGSAGAFLSHAFLELFLRMDATAFRVWFWAIVRRSRLV